MNWATASRVSSVEAGPEGGAGTDLRKMLKAEAGVPAPIAQNDDRKRISNMGAASKKSGIFETVQYRRKPTPLFWS